MVQYENKTSSAYVNCLCYRPFKPAATTTLHYWDGVVSNTHLNTHHSRNIAQIILSVFYIVVYILELLLNLNILYL